MRTLALALALTLGLAFAEPLVETITPNNTLTEAPTEWLGAEPHLVIMGTTSGFPFDFQLMDIANADLHELEVKREYLLNETDYSPYQEIDFGIQLVLEGVAKTIEAKLVHADFNKLGDLPQAFTLQSAEEFPEGSDVFTEFEFEWEGNGNSVNVELADWTGTATVNLDGAKGKEPSDEGLVGGYINATNGDDAVVISFTLDVTEFEVED